MNKKILITVTRIVTKNIHMDSQEFVRDNSKALYYKDLRLRLTSVSHPCARVIEPPEPKVVGSNPALLKKNPIGPWPVGFFSFRGIRPMIAARPIRERKRPWMDA
jgi:hypothetical protein